jgi:hypothetical protein
MSEQPIVKSVMLMVVLVFIAIAGWEICLRSKGFETSFDDDPALWAHQRDRVYESSDKATVFIGSSRIKFDLDIETWQNITGQEAVQLACVGSSPLPLLKDLADDEKFKGRLVVDVTEGLFFSTNSSRRPNERLKYYKEQTPAQRAGFHVNRVLESQFVFLDKDWLSLGAYLDHVPLENRKGVFHFPGFPSDFGRVKFNRQEYMTNKFAADTSLQNVVKKIWAGFDSDTTFHPTTGKKLDSIFTVVKTSVDKIKARGGEILFVRTPSSGSYLSRENKNYPRENYWDRLIANTNCPGIHFKDYPELSHFICPEESHLSLTEAKAFTTHFVSLLKEKGWIFPVSK